MMFCAAVVALTTVRFWLNRDIARQTGSIRQALARRLHLAVVNRDYLDHIQLPSASVTMSLTVRAEQVTDHLIIPAANLFTQTIMILAISAMMLWLAFWPTLAALVMVLSGYALLQRLTGRRIREASAMAESASKRLHQLAEDTTTGFKQLVIDQGRADRIEQLDAAQALAIRVRRRLTTVTTLPRLLVEGVGYLTIALSTLALVALGSTTVLAQIGVVALGAQGLLPVVHGILADFVYMRWVAEALEHVNGVLAAPVRAHLKASAKRLPWRRLRFRNVDFQYLGATRPALQAVDLAIVAGD